MIEEKTMGITTTLKKTYPRKQGARGGTRARGRATGLLAHRPGRDLALPPGPEPCGDPTHHGSTAGFGAASATRSPPRRGGGSRRGASDRRRWGREAQAPHGRAGAGGQRIGWRETGERRCAHQPGPRQASKEAGKGRRKKRRPSGYGVERGGAAATFPRAQARSLPMRVLRHERPWRTDGGATAHDGPWTSRCGLPQCHGLACDPLAESPHEGASAPSAYRDSDTGRQMGEGESPSTSVDPLVFCQGCGGQTGDGKPRHTDPWAVMPRSIAKD